MKCTHLMPKNQIKQKSVKTKQNKTFDYDQICLFEVINK